MDNGFDDNKNMKPELSECDTRPMGLITCMHAINKECVAKFNCEIDESELEYVMKTGMCDMEERFAQVVEEEIRKFTNKVFNTLREFNISLNITPITFVGGGAAVMKHYGEIESKTLVILRMSKQMQKGLNIWQKHL